MEETFCEVEVLLRK